MTRVTEKQLQSVVDRLNRITKSPLKSWTKENSNPYKSNVGNYHLDWAYGGVTLHRMMNEAGGIHDVLRVGYVPKRELLNLLFAYIEGIEYGK